MNISQLFKPKKLKLLGVDISPSSVKIIELTKKGEIYKVDNYAALGVENIAQSTNNTDEALQNIADVISDILSKYKIKTKHAAIALSNSKASVKVIEIPDDLLEDEVETQITKKEGFS